MRCRPATKALPARHAPFREPKPAAAALVSIAADNWPSAAERRIISTAYFQISCACGLLPQAGEAMAIVQPTDVMSVADAVSGARSPPVAERVSAQPPRNPVRYLRARRRPARVAARSLPRAGAVADLYRPRLAGPADLVHHPQLRLFRRRRNLHLHFGIYRSPGLWPRDLREGHRDRHRPHPAAGLADLHHASAAVPAA